MPLSLPGLSSTFVAFQAPDLNLTGGFSLSVWARPQLPEVGWDDGTMMSRCYNIGADYHFEQFQLNVNRNRYWHMWASPASGSEVELWSADASLNFGQWYYVTAVIATGANNCKLYADGAFIMSTTIPDICDSRLEIDLGVNSNGPGHTSQDQGYQGYLQDARIYNRALTQGEITTIYSLKGLDNITNGLVARWRLDEGISGSTVTTSTVKDSSASRFATWSVGGTPTYVYPGACRIR